MERDEVPEADAQEQEQDAFPEADDDEVEADRVDRVSDDPEAPEADALEQAQPVPGEDETRLSVCTPVSVSQATLEASAETL